jgi:hypothetical protein
MFRVFFCARLSLSLLVKREDFYNLLQANDLLNPRWRLTMKSKRRTSIQPIEKKDYCVISGGVWNDEAGHVASANNTHAMELTHTQMWWAMGGSAVASAVLTWAVFSFIASYDEVRPVLELPETFFAGRDARWAVSHYLRGL